MNLPRLLTLHAVVTLAAGVVLIVAPAAIPGTIDVPVGRQAYLLCYLLGAGEVSLAALSFFSCKLTDRRALQLVCLTFIIFHALTAIMEIYAFSQGTNSRIWGNVALRIAVTGLFFYYGFIRKLPE